MSLVIQPQQTELVIQPTVRQVDIDAGGAAGPQGKSAYQLAVEAGFVGTEAEWLESLQGEQGDPGAPGAAPQAYVHSQGVASADWAITHGLGYDPAGIEVVDSAGTPHDGVAEYVDLNNLILHFKNPFGGFARLS